MSDHYLRVTPWYAYAPGLELVCEAAPDAPCRTRPADADRETWQLGDPDLEPGHKCWAVEWIDAVGWEEAVATAPEAEFARVPVAVAYDEGVYLTPAPDNKE